MIPYVWPKWIDVKRTLDEMSKIKNNALLSALARSAYQVMLIKEGEGAISISHKIATVLHPIFKELTNIEEQSMERNKACLIKVEK